MDEIEDYPDTVKRRSPRPSPAAGGSIVRRTRLLGPAGSCSRLAALRRHHQPHRDITLVEAEHRDHAVVEQVIADLKDQALAHFPSGHFHANGAWTVLAAMAHNMLRWTQLLGLPDRPSAPLARCAAGCSGPRPPHIPRAWLDTAPARSLALARRLHHRPQRDPRAPRGRLTAAAAPATTSRRLGRPGRDHRCPHHPQDASAEALTRPHDRPSSTQPARRPDLSAASRQTRHPTSPIGGSGLRRDQQPGQPGCLRSSRVERGETPYALSRSARSRP